jgi:hypothetical protein
VTGGCQCGAITYVVEGEPEHSALCHCTDCRRAAGAPMVSWIIFPEEQVRIQGTPVTYRSSENVTREFCGTCGTGLFYRNPVSLPGRIDVQSCTLDDPEAAAPTSQIMCRERLGWIDRIDALPRFQAYPGVD